MAEFLIKFENRGIKIARVNSILITKFINLQLFTLRVRCDVGIFKLTASAQSIYREVYACTKQIKLGKIFLCGYQILTK